LAFTEQGATMRSGVLRSDRAIEFSIATMRLFVRLRERIASYKDLARKLADLERKCDERCDSPRRFYHAVAGHLVSRAEARTITTITWSPLK